MFKAAERAAFERDGDVVLCHCFVAASPDPVQMESWEQWQARWMANLPKT